MDSTHCPSNARGCNVVQEAKVKRPMFLLVCVSLISLVACGPGTPLPTPATVLPTTQPTVNFRATESSIISHVFATMTASAPTATKPPAVPPTAEPKPTATPRPRATAAVKATVPPAPPPPGVPKPTGDPYLSQIPKGKGGFLVVNYIGDHSAIVTFSPNKYTVAPNGTQLIVLDPGTYNYSVQIDGVPGGGSTGTVDITADKYTKYSVTLPQ